MAEAKHKVMVGVGTTLATGAAALSTLGPIGIVAGLVVGAVGAALASYGAYKMDPPREVWTEQKRREHRAAHPPQQYDDETPPTPRPSPRMKPGAV